MTKIAEFPRLQAVKAVILARVSSREQEEGHSIEAQKHRLNIYCQRRNLEVLRVFEITESSTQGDRKKFMQLIKFCKSQRQPIAIVADKVDRVQRSFKEYPLLDTLIQAGKIELHFNTEGYVIHRDSVSQERLMWSFGVIMAQSYVDNLRDNVKRSIEHKIRNGEYVSRAPLGYLNTKENGKSSIILDPERAGLVRALFTEFSTGLHSLAKMTAIAKDWGLRTREGNPISRPQIYALLHNPFYYGLMRVKGQLYPHNYPPLISHDLYEVCQQVFRNWNKKPFYGYGSIEFIFRGILTSKTTGRIVSLDTKRRKFPSGKEKQWRYLRSVCEGGKVLYVREEKVVKQVEEALKNLVLPIETIKATTAYLVDVSRTEHSFFTRKTEELQRENKVLQTRLTGLTELLMDGAITREEYDRQRAQYRFRQAEINEELQAHQQGDDGFTDALLRLMDLATKAPELFRMSNVDEKRALLNFVFSNLSLDGATLCYSYRIPFRYYAEMCEKEKWRPILDTLRNNIEHRREIIAFFKTYETMVKRFMEPFNSSTGFKPKRTSE